jgi:Flp pilus assembly protein TadD
MLRPSLHSAAHEPRTTAHNPRPVGDPDPAPASPPNPRANLVWTVGLWSAVVTFGAGVVLACADHAPPAPPARLRVGPVVAAADAGHIQDVANAVAVGVAQEATRRPDAARASSTATLLQQHAIPTAADDASDHRAAGEALLRSGRAVDAVVAFRKALAKDPSAAAWGALGAAYLRSGDAGAGVACLEEAVALDVDDEELRQSLTRQYLSQGDGRRARLHGEEWVRVAPQDPAARQALGRAYSQLGMWRQAIEQFTLVVAVQPDNAWARNNLGYAALQVGDTATAIAHLERAVEAQPPQAFMFNNLGVAYERTGHVAFAHAAFSRAAELSPKYAPAALNRDRVQRILDESTSGIAAAQLLRFRADETATNGSTSTTADAPPSTTAESRVELALPPMPSVGDE